jgi:endonuclease YncB( thermonuclease family)
MGGQVIPFRPRKALGKRLGRKGPLPGYRDGRPGRRVRLDRLAFLLALVLLGLQAIPDTVTAVAAPRTGGGCRVLSVTDGDTIRLWCPGRGVERARLMGFDAPEKFSPGCASELSRAIRATWHLRWLLAKAEDVAVVREGTDRYGRALVRAWIDEEALALRMVRDGQARIYSGGPRAGWCA